MISKKKCCHQLKILLTQDLREILRSKLPFFACGFYFVFFALFFIVALNESSVLGFTGMSRVLFSLSHGLLYFLPILALISTAESISHARENGTLEFMFSHPISRSLFFISTLWSRYLVLVIPFLLLIFGMNVLSFVFLRDQVSWIFLFRLFLISASLIWVFSNIGLFVSVFLRHHKVLVSILLIWIISICFIDLGIIGMMLKWPFSSRLMIFLALLNPVQISRVALLSGMEPELSVLGPVGFFVANKWSSTFLSFSSVLYSTLLGGVFWFFAQRRFCRSDVL